MTRPDPDHPAARFTTPSGASERCRQEAAEANDGHERVRRRRVGALPNPGPGHVFAALLTLVCACGPLLGIDDVDEVPSETGGVAGSGGAQGAPGTGGGRPGNGGGVTGGSGGSNGSGGGASGTGGKGEGGGPVGPVGFLRFANLVAPSPGGPEPLGFDVCFRQPGMVAWTGPILNGFGAPPLFFEQVSKHGPLPTGRYEFVAILGGTTNCEAPGAIGLQGGAFDLPEGAFGTIAVAGDPAKPELLRFVDGRPLGPDREEIELALAGATLDVGLVATFAGPNDTLALAYSDGGVKVVAAGAWPVSEINANGKALLAINPPSVSPPRGYTGFFVPAVAGAPLALLVCANPPPNAPDPTGSDCSHVVLSLATQPVARPAR